MNRPIPRTCPRTCAPRRARRISLVLGLLLALVGHGAQAAEAEDDVSPSLLAAAVLAEVNAFRSLHGLKPWQADPALGRLAQVHSGHLVGWRRLSHDGFMQRFDASGRNTCVENLARGFRDPSTMLQAWLASPAHARNLLDSQPTHVGLGDVRGYVTLLACTAAPANFALRGAEQVAQR